MHLVARLGKTQTHRLLPEVYRRLRHLTSYYDDDEEVLTATRQHILALIGELFPDYDKSATFTFDSTGAALFDAYRFDPYAICRAGHTRFKRKMKRRVRFCRFQTLEHLFACAEESVRHRKSRAEIEVLTDRLQALWRDYEHLTERCAARGD